MPGPLAAKFSEAIDQRFADHEFRILGRQFHRVLEFRQGRLVVRVTRDPDERAEILLNFDFQSKDPEQLKAWLGIPIGDIRDTARKILRESLELGDDDYVFEHNR